MMIFSAAALWALPLLASAAETKVEARFQKYLSVARSSPVIKLDDGIYDDLTAAPRDFSVLVQHTAMPASIGCEACKLFNPEFNILASSWLKGDRRGDSRVLFGSLDFPDGKGTFQKLGLTTAPVLLLYPPTIGPHAKPDSSPIRLDFTQGPQSAETIHAWMGRNLPEGPRPLVVRPFNYLRAATITTILLGGITFLGIAGPYLLPILQNRNLWAAISLITVLMFTSGHMFNHIRHVPYISGDGRGGIQYFAPGFGNQFGMETQIVAAMYGILAFAAISLALKVPRIADSKQQQLAVFVWGGIMFVMYSFLLKVFKIKNGGYPFHLPPF